MNERIRELAEQARKALATDAMSGGKFDMQAYEEKFAELIVRECARRVTRNEASNIFEHFGVNECISHKN